MATVKRCVTGQWSHNNKNNNNVVAGVSGVQVEEIYSLDQEQLQRLKPVHGLIFLFKWVADDKPAAGTVVMDSRADNMFFAKQVNHHFEN